MQRHLVDVRFTRRELIALRNVAGRIIDEFHLLDLASHRELSFEGFETDVIFSSRNSHSRDAALKLNSFNQRSSGQEIKAWRKSHSFYLPRELLLMNDDADRYRPNRLEMQKRKIFHLTMHLEPILETLIAHNWIFLIISRRRRLIELREDKHRKNSFAFNRWDDLHEIPFEVEDPTRSSLVCINADQSTQKNQRNRHMRLDCEATAVLCKLKWISYRALAVINIMWAWGSNVKVMDNQQSPTVGDEAIRWNGNGLTW